MRPQLTKTYLAFLFCLFFVGCGASPGTTSVGNPQPTITISQLVSNTATITMPTDVFDTSTASQSLMSRALTSIAFSSSALTGATFDIRVNGTTRYTSLNPLTYYHESSDSVIVAIPSIQDQDVLRFVIHLSNGEVANFSGTVSLLSESSATSDTNSSATGTLALETRDLSAAETAFCDAYDGGSTDSQIAFGCFLAKYLNLPETTDAQTLLTSLGESTIDVETVILAGVADDIAAGNSFSYAHYPELPLSEIFADSSLDMFQKMAAIAVRLNTSGTTIDELQTEIISLRDDHEYMEELLAVVLDDTSFTFVIPAELFGTDNDISVGYNDSRLCQAGIKSTIVGLNILDAYNLGVNAEDVVNTTDTDFDYQVLVADLNGTGETVNSVTVDTTAFMTLETESLITGSETRFVEAMEYLRDGAGEVNDGTSELFGESVSNVALEELEADAIALLDSIDNNTMATLSSRYHRTIYVNAQAFFTNPPSATDVTSSDPFVYEDGSIHFVEAYFRDLLTDVATF